MTQRAVERLVGMLVTDEALRHEFLSNPRATIEGLVLSGWDLHEHERAALESLDGRELDRFATSLDPRILKAALRPRGAPPQQL